MNWKLLRDENINRHDIIKVGIDVSFVASSSSIVRGFYPVASGDREPLKLDPHRKIAENAFWHHSVPTNGKSRCLRINSI